MISSVVTGIFGSVVGVIVAAVLISPGVLAGSLDIFGEGRCILVLSWRLFRVVAQLKV